jgi:NAD(P)-dependent dehydrogenase (short-subunit alcohol dehydrogenase family)
MTAQNSGSIVNISSVGGVYSIAGAAYSASKMAILGLTKNIAIQYAGTGIRCNAVCPGATDTDMLKGPPPNPQMSEIVSRRTDMTAGLVRAEDIANAVLFFCCAESECINGQYLVVDKGSCI